MGFAEFGSESSKKNSGADGRGAARGVHCPLLIFTNPREISSCILPLLLPVTLPPHRPTWGPWSPLSPFGIIRLFALLAKFIQFQLTVLFSIFLCVITSTPAGLCIFNKNLILLDIIVLGHFFSGPAMYNCVIWHS